MHKAFVKSQRFLADGTPAEAHIRKLLGLPVQVSK
jgi:hypothetical protein